MAKDKPKAKGQKSITAFFPGKSGKVKDEPPVEDEPADSAVEDNTSDVDMDDEPVHTTKKGKAKGQGQGQRQAKGNDKGKAISVDESNDPPIHDIPSIFSDLVSRVPKIKDVAQHVSGRKLRLIQKSILEQHQINLDIQHVFSCEIEPFKQAYIERNFHPPLLFRDVCELGNSEAHTAYGALAPVPGDVDLLVAGTSCVDYSNLNNEKQDIDANGESGRTFRGMMSWVTNHRPPIVILENVCSAPWDRVKEYFEAKGYSAAWSRVDTKQYYIPHTRTRVYLVAVDKKRSSIPDQWKQTLSDLKRPASSSLDAFLLPTDDPRIHQARQKLVQESYNGLDRRTGRTDWTRCESRHQRARLEDELGPKRPLTSWDDGGFCKLPDFAWNDWGVGQVERVWDLLDISLLRAATNGIDPSYKTQVWNLSQNVDRSTGSSRPGICPCLTPSMIPYITNRGGPMVGLEALSMQGLPVDKLLLTRETEDQLADLAGNAMSTTVVGSCILSALVCAQGLLKAGDDSESYESKKGIHMDSEETEEVMQVDVPTEVIAPEDRIIGEDRLVARSLNLAASAQYSLSELLIEAEKSARLCECEGRVDMTTRTLFRCQDCGTPFCEKCGGRPEHNPQRIDLEMNPRLPPGDFANVLKAILPMSISLSTVNPECLDAAKAAAGVDIPEERWTLWRSAVLRAVGSDLRFVEPKRQEHWSVVFESPHGMLELSLHPRQPEWRLFAKPLASEPANAPIRKLLNMPVGRYTCQGGVLDGCWEFALPHISFVDVTIEGQGEPISSWEARLGLTKPEFKDKKVFPQLQVTVRTEDLKNFDRDISGVYTLLEQCGTANGALHKRELEGEALPPLFMLLDPHRTNDSEDSFVFSTSRRRHQFGESRPIIAKLFSKWRPSSEEGPQTVQCCIPFMWVASSNVSLSASNIEEAHFSVPGETLEIDISGDPCRSATALLTCSVPLSEQSAAGWSRGPWTEVDKIHERSTFRRLAWILERIRDVGGNVNSWQTVHSQDIPCRCLRCAPNAPAIEWTAVGKKVLPIEDPVQAGEYERRLKSRPSPFVTQLRLTDDNVGRVRIGANIPSLLHRALVRLPAVGRTAQPTLSWKFCTNFTPAVHIDLPKFRILSNKTDDEHAQPPTFKLDLRVEQTRSLTWMLKQESKKAPPFIEEEISESVLAALGWRAEGRAQRAHHIRGGVLADQVGYGKTAITLALTDCAAKDVEKEFEALGRVPGKISIQATLVIVPPHLTRQWESEVRKFMKKGKKVVQLATVSNLNSATIESFMEADYIVVASNIFKSNVYLENLELLAGAGQLPNKDGRHFNAVLEKILEAISAQVDRLQDEGSEAVMQEIHAAQKRLAEEKERKAAAVQTKRLKGKSYRDAAEQRQANAESEAEEKSAPKKSAKVHGNGIPPPRGDKVEVVITERRPSGSPAAASSSRSVTEDESGSEADRRPKRKRRAAQKVIVLSDDEEDSEEEVKPKKGKKQVKAKPKASAKGKKRAVSDDDDDEDFTMASASDEEDAEDAEDTSPASSGEEDSPPLKKRKTTKTLSKHKPTAKSKVSKKKSVDGASSDDAMDVDESDAASTASKKRKAKDDGDRQAKKKRVDNDPWKLESKPVRKDWTQMKAPPFEMFHFARVVVDEYTYLDGKPHALITRLSSSRRWVLSGTPPIHDFAALKTIAAFLNIHLGVDDDGEGHSAEVKRRRREQTDVEKFHSFREVHTLEWHANRHEVGQRFLDQFVRQNIAEIDEIPWTDKTIPIVLPAAERAIYLELDHYLRNLDMTMKKSKKTESDREKRLAKALGDSKSAEEALLKRCSHFDLELTSEDTKKGKKKSDAQRNAMKACDIIVEERENQLEECKSELLTAVKAGLKREKVLSQIIPTESMFHEWIRVTRSDEGIEDKEATDIIRDVLEGAGVGVIKAKPKKDDSKAKDQLKEKDAAAAWEHREKTHEIRKLAKELVGRVRSLRYFKVVRDLQKQRDTPPIVDCPKCQRKNVPIPEVSVLSSCGHMGCSECVKSCADNELCVYAASKACRSAARALNIVHAATLGVDDEARDKGRHFGMKLERVVKLIKDDITDEERVLVFVQFPDLMKKVGEAFAYNGIPYLEIKGTASVKSKNLEAFQNNSKERVLLLNVMDESASGANLTSANHAIFLSPLLAPSKEIYTACETQAVGRLVRYGQSQHVHVHRFVTTNTIDEDIYAKRRQEMGDLSK
ncbi:hypothetical protein BDZ89DRAFT_1058637 [Hymenopellis radicata]|nr:hypothetical protein BDZ89DRAFT_1058637 [Hymenopellis radicata]